MSKSYKIMSISYKIMSGFVLTKKRRVHQEPFNYSLEFWFLSALQVL